MKSLITRENIWLFLVGFTLCSFAGSERINSWGIIAICLFTVVDINLIDKIKKTIWLKNTVPMFTFFGVYLLFFLFSERDADATHALVSKLSFFLLPAAFTIENYFTKKNEQLLMLVFSMALSISLGYQISSSLLDNYFLAKSPNLSLAFNRIYVSSYIMHPGYFSAFLLTGIIWHTIQRNKYSLLFISIFTIGIIILLSRIVILIYALFFLSIGIQYIRNSANKLRNTFLLIFAFILSCFAVYQIPLVKHRIVATVENINNTNKKINLESATASRRITYEQELYLVFNKPLLGYGLGNATKKLREYLTTKGYTALGKDMNTHNQYVNTWMNTGIFGLLALLTLLGSSLLYFKKNNRGVPLWLALMICFLLLTDDLLEIQANCVFFALILSLYHTEKKITYS